MTGPAENPAPEIPPAVAAPIENALGVAGTFAQGASEWLSTRGAGANSRARPWLEFADLSAFGLAEGGCAAYIERVQINARYFLFNYLMLGLVLTILSTITKPVALIGAALLVWIYFQLFGAENANEEVHFFGLNLNDQEKVGVMVVLGSLLFWFLAGGLSVFFSIITATIFITFIHGALRKPSPEYAPIVVPTV